MKKWSSDRWLSMIAIIASLGTLFTVVYQTNLIRKQQYASVLPYLELWNSSQKDSYQLMLVNNGIGPAFIEEVRIHYLDSVYQMDPAIFLKEVVRKTDSIYNVGHSNISKGRLVPAGEIVNLLEVRNDRTNSKKLWSWFSGDDKSRKEKPVVEIVYRSVYEESWKIRQHIVEPEKLN